MIEKQFINNLGHQQIIVDRLTVNNLDVNTPLIITKFVNLAIYQRTERPQYSCRNPSITNHNRGGEIGSQHQDNANKEDLSRDCWLLNEEPLDDRKDCHYSPTTQNDINKIKI